MVTIVNLVPLDVKLVPTTPTTVPLVKKTELNNHLSAHVLSECLKSTLLVNLVTINVTLVYMLLIIVKDVPKTEWINQPVIALSDISLSLMNQNVHLVDIDVKLVKVMNTIVFLVLMEDTDYQIVAALTIHMILVSQNVNLVTTNVMDVILLMITVMLVLLTELILKKDVHVHSNQDIMKLSDKPTVHLVTSDVKLVQLIKLVKFVLMILTEPLNQFVIVLLDSLKTTLKSVHHVTSNVLNVSIIMKTVPSVETQESTHQFVTVQIIYTPSYMNTQTMLNVILVPNNVIPVSMLKITVWFVPLKDQKETHHQSAQSLDKELTPLKSMISQLVPPELLTVTANVPPVPKPDLTVTLVMPTE